MFTRYNFTFTDESGTKKQTAFMGDSDADEVLEIENLEQAAATDAWNKFQEQHPGATDVHWWSSSW